MNGEKIRSFIALPLAEQTKKELGPVIEALKSHSQGIKWVRPENLHLTLKFLGYVGPELLDRTEGVCRQAAGEFKPFKAKLGGLGFFPNPGSPRVIWIGLEEGEEEVKKIANRIEEGITKDFPPEPRPFETHLTIGRVKDKKGGRFDLPPDFRVEDFTPFDIEKVVIMKSDLRPSGPIYTVLKEFELGG